MQPGRFTSSLVFYAPRPLAAAALACCALAANAQAPSRAYQIDDDFLALMQNDRDYTAGIYVTFAKDDRAFEAGLRLFTPRNIEAEAALPGDRPYATLAYLTGSRLALDQTGTNARQSSLTFGVLGLPIVGAFHRSLHRAIGSPLPNGYGHQISNGGEPTFRYTVSRRHLLVSGEHDKRPYALSYGVDGSIGYISEVGAGLVFRSGPSRVPWWGGPPISSDYAGQPAMLPPAEPDTAPGRGVIFEAGIESRFRLYNAFLQGQFRDSDVKFASGKLEHLLLEAWLGVGFRLESGFELSYTIRRQSPGIAHGTGARAFTWGNVSIAHRF